MEEHSFVRSRGFVIALAMILSMTLGLGNVEQAQASQANSEYTSLSKVDSALTGVRSYVLQLLDNFPEDTSYYGTSSEWMLLSLARDKPDQKESVYSQYFADASAFIKENNGKVASGGSREKPTDYERIILALTAMGYDATDIGGHNLFTYLSTQSNVTWQGINSVIFALLAVDSSSNYAFLPASATGAAADDVTTKQSLIDYLLSKQLSDGGWNLFGTKSDVDLTSMALQALAPFKGSSEYDADSKVTDAINKALTTLSGLQAADGSFSSSLAGAGSNSNSQAQVVTALAALGITDTDSRFVKNGNTAISSMLSFYIEGSGFKYLATQTAANGMATEQCYYALVAYERAARGKNSLYNMDKETPASDPTDSDSSQNDNSSSQSNKGASTQKKNSATSSDSARRAEAKSADTILKTVIFSPVIRESSVIIDAKNAQKKDSSKKSDDSKSNGDGWSFSGDEYQPASASSQAAGTVAAGHEGVSAPIVVAIAAASALLGGFVTGGVVVLSKKKAGVRHA